MSRTAAGGDTMTGRGRVLRAAVRQIGTTARVRHQSGQSGTLRGTTRPLGRKSEISIGGGGTRTRGAKNQERAGVVAETVAKEAECMCSFHSNRWCCPDVMLCFQIIR